MRDIECVDIHEVYFDDGWVLFSPEVIDHSRRIAVLLVNRNAITVFLMRHDYTEKEIRDALPEEWATYRMEIYKVDRRPTSDE